MIGASLYYYAVPVLESWTSTPVGKSDFFRLGLGILRLGLADYGLGFGLGLAR